ncbi:cytidylate kinase-like family protein [Deltaproteobacteria bacterium TL4]
MTVHFTITPEIDKRISAWGEFTQKTQKQQATGPCVTISREYGCQAYLVAEILQKRLLEKSKGSQWIVLDRELLEKIANESGISRSDIERVGDVNPVFQSMISMFMGQHRAEQFEVFSYVKQAVRHFAKAGNSIIIGRGGAALTQDLPNCTHILLTAPLEFRIKNVMKNLNLDRAEAEEQIVTRQQQRENFIKNFTKNDPRDSTLYHAVINNGRYSPERVVDIIEALM